MAFPAAPLAVVRGAVRSRPAPLSERSPNTPEFSPRCAPTTPLLPRLQRCCTYRRPRVGSVLCSTLRSPTSTSLNSEGSRPIGPPEFGAAPSGGRRNIELARRVVVKLLRRRGVSASTAPGEDTSMSADGVAEFYDRTFDDVYRYLCRAVLGNRQLAEDLTQETFASVVATQRSGVAELPSVPWVIGVARHKLADHYRRTDSEHHRMALVWANDHHSDDDQFDELDRESPQRVLDLLCGLSPSHRLVLAFRYVDELSVEEIADALGRSVHATESLLVRARRALITDYRSKS